MLKDYFSQALINNCMCVFIWYLFDKSKYEWIILCCLWCKLWRYIFRVGGEMQFLWLESFAYFLANKSIFSWESLTVFITADIYESLGWKRLGMIHMDHRMDVRTCTHIFTILFLLTYHVLLFLIAICISGMGQKHGC